MFPYYKFAEPSECQLGFGIRSHGFLESGGCDQCRTSSECWLRGNGDVGIRVSLLWEVCPDRQRAMARLGRRYRVVILFLRYHFEGWTGPRRTRGTKDELILEGRGEECDRWDDKQNFAWVVEKKGSSVEFSTTKDGSRRVGGRRMEIPVAFWALFKRGPQ